MKTLAIFSLMILTAMFAMGQQTYVNNHWSTQSPTASTASHSVTVAGSGGAVYVLTSLGDPLSGASFSIAMFDSDGQEVWTYDSVVGENEFGVDLVFENDLLALATVVETSLGSGIRTYELAADLEVLWSSEWLSGVEGVMSWPMEVELDANGAVHVCGISQVTAIDSDIQYLKYSDDGSLLTELSYDHSGGIDLVSGIGVSGGGAMITGTCQEDGLWSIVRVSIDTNEGIVSEVVSSIIDGLTFSPDEITAVAYDGSDVVYFGATYVQDTQDIEVVKMTIDDGFEWNVTIDQGYDETLVSAYCANNGDVVLAGSKSYSESASNIITVRLSEAGDELWSREFGSRDQTLIAEASTVNELPDGTIIVGGKVAESDFWRSVTIGYSSEGRQLFVKYGELLDEIGTVEVIPVLDEIRVSHTGREDSETFQRVEAISVNQRVIEVEYDANGVGYVLDQLIVRFGDGEIYPDVLYDKEKKSGTLSEFISPERISEITIALGYEAKDLRCFKVFPRLTPETTHSTTRLGQEIPMPSFWNVLVVNLPNGASLSQSIGQLESTFPLVRYACRDFVGTLHDVPNDLYFQSEMMQRSIGADLDNYSLSHIGVVDAWDISVGSPEVKVGVFDGPIYYQHEDFGDGTWEGSKIAGGWDYFNDTSIPDSPNFESATSGHGTMCAGIIGALRNNEIGVAGIAGGDSSDPEDVNIGCELYSMQILPPSGALSSSESYELFSTSVAPGIIEGGSENTTSGYGFGLHVQSHSWGVPTLFDGSPLLKEAMIFNWRNGCVFVSSEGNSNSSAGVRYPADVGDQYVMSVIASGKRGQRKKIIESIEWDGSLDEWDINWGSNFGPFSDFMAPGSYELVVTTMNPLVSIESTVGVVPWESAESNFEVMETDYTHFAGTSAACPHVAGVAALMVSAHSEANGAPNNLAPEDVEQILERTANDVVGFDQGDYYYYEEGYDDQSGHGLVNADQALQNVAYPIRYVQHSGSPDIVSTEFVSVSDIELIEAVEGLSPGLYSAEKHKVTLEFQDNITSGHQIIGYWERMADSYGGSNTNTVSLESEEFEIFWDISLGTEEADVEVNAFVYRIEDSDGNLIWVPRNPESIDFRYSIHVEGDGTLGVDTEPSLEIVSAFPVPTTGELYLQISGSAAVKKVEIYDVSGRMVFSDLQPELDANHGLHYNVESFATGSYIASVDIGWGTKKIQFIKL